MFIDMSVVREMQVPVMKVILVALMLDNRMTATGAVSVGVFIMNSVFAHNASFPMRWVKREHYVFTVEKIRHHVKPKCCLNRQSVVEKFHEMA